MHYFAEYGADAAHWQYKERTYAATASIDEDTSAALAAAPPGAASAPKGNASGAAREANWAKFVLSQQVRHTLLGLAWAGALNAALCVAWCGQDSSEWPLRSWGAGSAVECWV